MELENGGVTSLSDYNIVRTNADNNVYRSSPTIIAAANRFIPSAEDETTLLKSKTAITSKFEPETTPKIDLITIFGSKNNPICLDDQEEEEEEDLSELDLDSDDDDPDPVQLDPLDLENPVKCRQLLERVRYRNSRQKEDREKKLERLFADITKGSLPPDIPASVFADKRRMNILADRDGTNNVTPGFSSTLGNEAEMNDTEIAIEKAILLGSSQVVFPDGNVSSSSTSEKGTLAPPTLTIPISSPVQPPPLDNKDTSSLDSSKTSVLRCSTASTATIPVFRSSESLSQSVSTSTRSTERVELFTRRPFSSSDHMNSAERMELSSSPNKENINPLAVSKRTDSNTAPVASINSDENLKRSTFSDPANCATKRSFTSFTGLRIPSLGLKKSGLHSHYRRQLLTVIGGHAKMILSFDGDLVYLVSSLIRLGLFVFPYKAIFSLAVTSSIE